MKYRRVYGLLLVVLLLLAQGCSKKPLPIEDYVRSNPATSGMSMIMKSDSGYYYSTLSGREMELHYFDVESGQNIYLCSKPECRHDGDTFCTASNEKYHVNSAYFYGDNLYLAAVEETEEEYQYKIIRVSADGSELTEVITYMTVNKSSTIALYGGEPAIIHRGVMVLPYWLCGTTDVQNGIAGTYLYNLTTGELTQLPELEYSTYNLGRKRFTGYGDYIYFHTRMNRKNTLSRYCLSDGTVEELGLESRFDGKYEIMDENTIYYTYGPGRLYEYNISTKKNTQHDDVFVEKIANPEYEGIISITKRYTFSDMITDGTYLYAGNWVEFRESGTEFVGGYLEHEDGSKVEILPCVYVYNRQLEEVAKVEISTKDMIGEYEHFSLAILDDTVYVKTTSAVFTCTLEEFLKGGRPNFELLYTHQDMEYEKYN